MLKNSHSDIHYVFCACHSFLVKRLEQFEVLDEIPRSKFSLNSDLLSNVIMDEKALLVTAIKIRGELDTELARLKPQGETSDYNSKFLNIPSNAHHGGTYSTGSVSPVNNLSSSTSLQSHVTSTPLQSPIASVITTPSSLVPASVPTLSTGATTALKGKKAKLSKGQHKALAPSDKRKGNKGSSLLRKKKPDVDPNAPKKPSNAFFWFCQEKRAPLQEQFRGEGMSGQHDLTKALAKLWSETDTEHKKVMLAQK